MAENDERTLSLAELKAENEKNPKPEETDQEEDENFDSDDQESAKQDDSDETDTSAQDDSEDDYGSDQDDSDDDDDSDEKDKQRAEKEPWMVGDEDDEADEPADSKIPDSEAAKIRRKYKGKVKEKDEQLSQSQQEIKKLQQQIKELQENKTKSAPKDSEKPVRDDYKSDDEYFEALTDYKLQLDRNQQKSTQEAERQRKEQERAKQAMSEEVDKHYERAHKLAESSGISADAYRNADLKVREAVNDLFPDAGDAITDALIYTLGEGSERVFYHLGVNSAKRAEFIDRLKADPNGLKATAYLSALNAEMGMNKKRTSKAPKPGEKIQGDKQNAGGDSLYEEYKKAHSRGNTQKAFTIKRKAKLEHNVDTSDW